jgi:V/A-type H+-transporting ATPase subunit C
MDDTRYTYAVARINALSTKLLDRAFASRMLAAEPNEILRMLGETAYAESFAGVENATQMEKGLLRELQKTHDLLDRICPDKELISLFRVRYDFHNLKAMLKSQITGIPHTDSIIDLGTYNIGELSAAVREKSYRFVPRHIRDTALDALAEYEKVSALYAISYTCDRSMWCYLMDKALKRRNKTVIELFREYINLANIKTFFRVKEVAEDREVFERYFVPGGDYPLDFFFRHMDAELGHFLDHLSRSRYERHIVSQGLSMWPEDTCDTCSSASRP